MRGGHYFCAACQAFGKGEKCWCCGSMAVERDGTMLDIHVYDWDTEDTVHRYQPRTTTVTRPAGEVIRNPY